MNDVHFYTETFYPDGRRETRQVRLLCSGKFERQYPDGKYQLSIGTTVFHRVSCLNCLLLVMPKMRAQLKVMEKLLEYKLEKQNESSAT